MTRPDMLPLIVGIASPVLSPEEEALFRRFRPAGYILFGRNVKTPAQVRSLTDSLRRLSEGFSPIICMDQEGGRVSRIGALGIALPSAEILADQPSAIAEAAVLTAEALSLLGVTLNLAPVVDIFRGHSNALPSRCWGRSAKEVIRKAGRYNRALNEAGLASCLKHFPGMGQANEDPHFRLPVVAASLSELNRTDLLPFRSLLPEAPAVMISHILLPSVDERAPASLSSVLVRDLLRTRLGYGGLVLTDDLCMGAISRQIAPADACVAALRAGNDLPLLCHDVPSHLPAAAASLAQLLPKELAEGADRISGLLSARDFPPMDPDQWAILQRRSHALMAQMPEPREAGAAFSPVQDY
ncbi:MAG: glycosyl hydrolase [Akkermansia sp.]|nr:glycosyl hydrolase [Akkermansia sp.]